VKRAIAEKYQKGLESGQNFRAISSLEATSFPKRAEIWGTSRLSPVFLFAWAIMNESKVGHKVKCHKAAVDFFELLLPGKTGKVPSVPEFVKEMSGKVSQPAFALNRGQAVIPQDVVPSKLGDAGTVS
jgi:hypothetical protein